jgi:hypothetical protein
LTAVRIAVDADKGTITPKNCHVVRGTEIAWWEAKGKPFQTDFSLESPDKSGKMHFDSKPDGSHQEATLKANKGKDKDPQQTFNYKATAGGHDIDPAIIVDPHQNK